MQHTFQTNEFKYNDQYNISALQNQLNLCEN